MLITDLPRFVAIYLAGLICVSAFVLATLRGSRFERARTFAAWIFLCATFSAVLFAVSVWINGGLK